MNKSRIKLLAKDVLDEYLHELSTYCSDICVSYDAYNLSDSEKAYYELVFKQYVESMLKRLNA